MKPTMNINLRLKKENLRKEYLNNSNDSPYTLVCLFNICNAVSSNDVFTDRPSAPYLDIDVPSV